MGYRAEEVGQWRLRGRRVVVAGRHLRGGAKLQPGRASWLLKPLSDCFHVLSGCDSSVGGHVHANMFDSSSGACLSAEGCVKQGLGTSPKRSDPGGVHFWKAGELSGRPRYGGTHRPSDGRHQGAADPFPDNGMIRDTESTRIRIFSLSVRSSAQWTRVARASRWLSPSPL